MDECSRQLVRDTDDEGSSAVDGRVFVALRRCGGREERAPRSQRPPDHRRAVAGTVYVPFHQVP